MLSEREQIEVTINALEAQRALLGDVFVDSGITTLRAKLAALGGSRVEAPVPEQSLRQVTILFLDIVGSTSLSSKLDPEENHAVMDDALARCTAIVLAHGGRVLQYAGDNLLAVFGTPEAREDDPERAVRAGLDLLAETRRIGAEILERYDHPGFNARVGIHTGSVLLGGGVEADGSIRGIAVTIAARMEQTAPAGGLRISHDTYRHVRGIFDVDPQPPLHLKGVEEPFVTYLALRAKPRAFRITSRGIEGIETRMIGRDAELALLQATLLRVDQTHTLQAINVVADAGMGKSRLLYQFQVWAEARPALVVAFQGRADPSRQGQPYGLLRDILTWRLQLSETDTMQEAKDKLEAGIAPLFADRDGADMAQAQAHLLGHLVGLDFSDSPHVAGILEDSRQIRNRAFHAASQMFRLVSERENAPIILNLEDLHWADDGSLDFLMHLVRVNRDVPMMVLGLTRPSLFERRPEFSASGDEFQRVDLKPLDKDLSRLLVNELLKKLKEVPAALRELVIGGAEGNPFYMEELVKMLVDQGAIRTGAEEWSLEAEKLLATHVPSSLTGVVQARLDELSRAERRALQLASIIGVTFSEEALGAIDEQAPSLLPALMRRELLVRRPDASTESNRAYTFAHQILHGVTYGTILKRDRRALHAKTAAWLAGKTGSRASDSFADTAEHYQKAGDEDAAAEFFTRAAEQAKERFAHAAALDYVERALPSVIGRDSPEKLRLAWRLVSCRERILNSEGRRAEQRVSLALLSDLAEKLDDDQRRAEIAIRHSQLAMRLGVWVDQERSAREAMALAERAQDNERKLLGMRLLSIALPPQGRVAEGVSLAEKGIAEAQAHGLRRVESLLLGNLSVIASDRGDLMAFRDFAERALILTRELGDRQNESVFLSNLGDCWLELGDLGRAREMVETALKLMRAVGTRSMEPSPLLLLATIAFYLGQEESSLALAREAVQVARDTQARHFEMGALWVLGNAEWAMGHEAEATTAYEACYALAGADHLLWQEAAIAALARSCMARGDTQTALQWVNEVVNPVKDATARDPTGINRWILFTCHEVLAGLGDPRAAVLLGRAHRELLTRAETIPHPELREKFLNDIPHHRAIARAWSEQHSAERV